MQDSYWISNIFSRQDWANWTAGGSRTVYDRAHEFVEGATVGYKNMDPVKSKEICDGLDSIVKEAWSEMKLQGKVRE
jgi:trimethylamine:corrinoid methyltransferase-like protein